MLVKRVMYVLHYSQRTLLISGRDIVYRGRDTHYTLLKSVRQWRVGPLPVLSPEGLSVPQRSESDRYHCCCALSVQRATRTAAMPLRTLLDRTLWSSVPWRWDFRPRRGRRP